MQLGGQLSGKKFLQLAKFSGIALQVRQGLEQLFFQILLLLFPDSGLQYLPGLLFFALPQFAMPGLQLALTLQKVLAICLFSPVEMRQSRLKKQAQLPERFAFCLKARQIQG